MSGCPAHCPLDIHCYLLSGGEEDIVHGRDVIAGHAEPRMAEKRLDSQFAQAQFVGRDGVGMTKAMRRVVGADNPPPRLGEY